jgi:hypothetical protein
MTDLYPSPSGPCPDPERTRSKSPRRSNERPSGLFTSASHHELRFQLELLTCRNGARILSWKSRGFRSCSLRSDQGEIRTPIRARSGVRSGHRSGPDQDSDQGNWAFRSGLRSGRLVVEGEGLLLAAPNHRHEDHHIPQQTFGTAPSIRSWWSGGGLLFSLLGDHQ